MDVSVVIPTTGRAELRRALESVRAQEMKPAEIIVVADTDNEIDIPDSELITVLRVGPGAGGNVARQAGIELARGELVALLDDDDEWLPNHLSEQLRTLANHSSTNPRLVFSRVVLKSLDRRDRVVPEVLYQSGSDLVEYMFQKRRIRQGVGFVQASGFLFDRELALNCPFPSDQRFHQDIDWLVRVRNSQMQVSFVQNMQATAIHHVVEGSVSWRIRARDSAAWGKSSLSENGPRVFGDFILTHSLKMAQRTGSINEMLWVLRFARSNCRAGVPAWIYALLLTGRSLVSSFRARLMSLV